MVEATKTVGGRTKMGERIGEALDRMESRADEMSRMERLRMRASVKIMRKSLSMFEKGIATVQSARSGLDALAESALLSRKDHKEVNAAVSSLNKFFESRDATPKTGTARKGQRIRKIMAAGALGFALAGTAKLHAQTPGQQYQQQGQQQYSSQSYRNGNSYADPQMQMLERQQGNAIQQLRDVQENQLEDYQKRSEVMIKNLMKEHLPAAQVGRAVNEQMQSLNRMETYQEQQMANLIAQQAEARRELMNQEMIARREQQRQSAYLQQQQAAIRAEQQANSIRNQVTQTGIAIGMNYLQYQLYRHW